MNAVFDFTLRDAASAAPQDEEGESPDMQKRNATAAVIGAGDYIGAEIAKKFAAEGFTVFAGRRDGAKLEPLVRVDRGPHARCAEGGRGRGVPR
jgi:hypothetical protein